MGWHKSGCALNPFKVWEDANHEDYIALGKRQHVAEETPEPLPAAFQELLDALFQPNTRRPDWF
jgi:hypothetical protein